MMCLYSALLCIAVHPKRFTDMWGGGGGGSLLNHHQCAASTWMMRRLPQHNGARALTTHQLQVERRERDIEPIKLMWDYINILFSIQLITMKHSPKYIQQFIQVWNDMRVKDRCLMTLNNDRIVLLG